MRIAKPILLVATPIGVIGGLYEAYKLAGGLVFLMAALIAIISAAIGMLVLTIREEQAAERAAKQEASPDAPSEAPSDEANTHRTQ